MNRESGRTDKARHTGASDEKARASRPQEPAMWVETLAGMVPFVFLGLWAIVNAWPSFLPDVWLRFIWVGLLLVGYLVALVGFVAGWVRGFPHWSYGYVVCVPLFSLYMGALRISRQELLGWRSLIPLGIAAAIALALTRSLRPLIRLVTGVWDDWTRGSFALYSLMPLVVWVAFDEVGDRFELPFMVVLNLILIGGALAYMRSRGTWRRVLVLVGSLACAWIVTTVGISVYWHGRQESWMTEPGNGFELALRSTGGLVVLVVFLLLPSLLGLLRRSIGPIWPSRAA